LEACQGRRDFNVILDIKDSQSCGRQELQVLKSVDLFLKGHGSNSIQTVANTIFPSDLYKNYGLRGVFEVYLEKVYPQISSLSENKWGTYFHRMVYRVSADNKTINPIEQIINRLKCESKNVGGKRARYELNLIEPFIDLSTSDPTLKGDTMALGGPCMSHLSFKLRPDNVLGLTAFYRSHYYIERALGNLIGLSRLMAFVAKESNLSAGPLTCISSYAQLDTGPKWGKVEVDRLISACTQVIA